MKWINFTDQLPKGTECVLVCGWNDVHDHLPPYGKLVLVKGTFDNEPMMLAQRRERIEERQEDATKVKVTFYDVFSEVRQGSGVYGYDYRINDGRTKLHSDKCVTHWIDIDDLIK